MELRKLTDDAYSKFSQLPQFLKKKDRGYGLVPIEIDGYIFAIPLRSNLNHAYGMKTLFDKKEKVWKGLDYSKALVLKDNELLKEAFKTKDQDEFDKIKSNEEKIKKEFLSYLNGYKKLISSGGDISKNPRYKFTTLQYFDEILGIKKKSS
jgi:protein AbiQ